MFNFLSFFSVIFKSETVHPAHASVSLTLAPFPLLLSLHSGFEFIWLCKDGGCFYYLSIFLIFQYVAQLALFHSPPFLFSFFFLVLLLFPPSCLPPLSSLVFSGFVQQTAATVASNFPWCVTSLRASSSSKPRPSSPGRSSSRFTEASKTYENCQHSHEVFKELIFLILQYTLFL